MRSLLLSAVLVAGFYGVTEAQAVSPPTPAFNAGGAFFALSVSDLDASVRWYSEKLGLRVVMQAPKHERTSVVALEGGGLIVELLQNDDAKPLKTLMPSMASDILIHGPFKVGLIVENFDSVVATLRERGIPIAFGPFPASQNQRANLIIRDNSGNLIQLLGK